MTRSVAWFDDDSSVSVAGLAGRWAALARCRFLRKSGNVHTGAAKRWGTREYFRQPGLDRDSRLWLVGQGIHMIGIDARTLDREFAAQIADFKRTSDGRHIWPAHFAGITKEYCQVEKLTNLDQLPQPHGFYVPVCR